MTDPILITGCARSGTSMVAGAVHLCGAFGGKMSGPNQNNKKGMFENSKIRQTIVKPYFRELGVDALGQFPLPDIDNLEPFSDLRKRVERVMIEQGYTGGPWMYKGAKLCLIWKLWHEVFPNAKWIIVRRRTGDIITSCLRTNFMRAFRNKFNQRIVGAKDEREGWLWWVHQHEDRFREMLDPKNKLDCKVVWPERMIQGDYRQMYETIDWLGLQWSSEVMAFIDHKLWTARNYLKPAVKIEKHGVLNNG